MTGSICNIFYGSGTASNQRMNVHLGVSVTEGLIPAGSTFSWSVATSGGSPANNSEVPRTNYDPNGRWTLSMSPAVGTVTDSFTVTMTFTDDYPVPSGGQTWCDATLIYDNSDETISPATEFTITSNGASGPGVASGGTGSLAWKLPKRQGTNARPTQSMRLRSKTGTQSCYPTVQFSAQGNNPASMGSNGFNCGDGENNTSLIYPVTDECKFFRISGEQQTHPEVC